MSRLRVFRQTGWFIAGLMTGLPATAAPAETSSMAGVAVAVNTKPPPIAGYAPHVTGHHVTGHAVLSAGVRGAGAA